MTAHYSYSGSTFIAPNLAVTVNGVNTHGEFEAAYITQNATGQYGIGVSSGTLENGDGFDVKFTNPVAGLVKTDKLPYKIFSGNFQTATFFTHQDPDDAYSGAIVV